MSCSAAVYELHYLLDKVCVRSHYFISELIITSGGENIAPVPIEDRIKKEVPFLSNVMIVGDNHNYLTCLMTLKVCVSQLGKLHFLACSHLTFTSPPPPPPSPPPPPPPPPTTTTTTTTALSLISHYSV